MKKRVFFLKVFQKCGNGYLFVRGVSGDVYADQRDKFHLRMGVQNLCDIFDGMLSNRDGKKHLLQIKQKMLPCELQPRFLTAVVVLQLVERLNPFAVSDPHCASSGDAKFHTLFIRISSR